MLYTDSSEMSVFFLKKKKNPVENRFSHFANDDICYEEQPDKKKKKIPVLVPMLASKN